MIKLFEKKLKDLGGIGSTNSLSKKIVLEIKSILPDYLAYILNNYGGEYFVKDVVATKLNKLPISSDGNLSLGSFIDYCNENTIGNLQEQDARFFKTIVPFMEGLPSDYILIGIKGNYLGKIFYWHHEAVTNEELHLIYNSFEEFIENLEVEESPGDDREVISVRLDF